MQTVVEILVDFSSSMSGKLVKTKKILLNKVIPALDFTSRIGVKTFSTTGNTKELKIEEKLPLSIIHKERLYGVINGLQNPNGNTPIAAAIEKSVRSLGEYRAYDKKIILVTDGEENCGGDYEQEAANARRDGIECEIHVIGLDLKSEPKLKAERIAKITGGTLINIALNSIVGDNYSPIANQIEVFTSAVKRKTVKLASPGNGSVNTGTPRSTTFGLENPIDSSNGPIVEPGLKSLPDDQIVMPTIKLENEDILVPEDQPGQHLVDETLSIPSDDEQDEAILKSEESEVGLPIGNIDLQEEYQNVESKIDNPEDTGLEPSSIPTNNLQQQPLELEIKSVKSTLEVVVRELQSIKTDLADIRVKSGPEEEHIEIKEDPVLNESIREASEKFVFELLNKKYPERVKWLNEKGEIYEDHDFEIMESENKVEYYIECKGTSTDKNSFLLTKNEWLLFLNNTTNYQVYFVKNALSEKQDFIFINNLLDWIMKGKIVPYFNENFKLKLERIPFTILE